MHWGPPGKWFSTEGSTLAFAIICWALSSGGSQMIDSMPNLHTCYQNHFVWKSIEKAVGCEKRLTCIQSPYQIEWLPWSTQQFLLTEIGTDPGFAFPVLNPSASTGHPWTCRLTYVPYWDHIITCNILLVKGHILQQKEV